MGAAPRTGIEAVVIAGVATGGLGVAVALAPVEIALASAMGATAGASVLLGPVSDDAAVDAVSSALTTGRVDSCDLDRSNVCAETTVIAAIAAPTAKRR